MKVEINTPLVSCIIIFYNAQKFITEAIQSVLWQSYGNWELILVDDGSQDKSTEIAKNFCENDPDKIVYLEHSKHKNIGMSASRNLGIRYASGEFISFLDADDIWLPEKLSQQVEIMKKYPEAGMVYGYALLWYSWNEKQNEKKQDYFLDLSVKPNSLIQPPELFYILLQNKAQTPIPSCAMLRYSIFDKIDLFEEEFDGMYEDQVFFAKVHLHFPVYIADECWIKYRQHHNSYSYKNKDQNYYIQRLPFLTWLSSYLMNNGFEKNLNIMRAFQKELRAIKYPRFYQTINNFYTITNSILHFFKKTFIK